LADHHHGLTDMPAQTVDIACRASASSAAPWFAFRAGISVRTDYRRLSVVTISAAALLPTPTFYGVFPLPSFTYRVPAATLYPACPHLVRCLAKTLSAPLPAGLCVLLERLGFGSSTLYNHPPPIAARGLPPYAAIRFLCRRRAFNACLHRLYRRRRAAAPPSPSCWRRCCSSFPASLCGTGGAFRTCAACYRGSGRAGASAPLPLRQRCTFSAALRAGG